MRRNPRRRRNPNTQIYMCTALFVFLAARIVLPHDPLFAGRLPLTYLAAVLAAAAAVALQVMAKRLKERRSSKEQ